MSYFIHKINPGGGGACEREMLEILKKYNLVTIGFSLFAKEFDNNQYKDKTKEVILDDFKHILEKVYNQGKTISQPTSLYNFIYEMKKDDIVVIPLSQTTKNPKTYYIVKITDDLLLKPEILANKKYDICKESIGFLRFCEILSKVEDTQMPKIIASENTMNFTTKLIETEDFEIAVKKTIREYPYKKSE